MIHQTAIIHPNATIGKNVKIGPFCVIGKNVTLERDVELKSHVVIDGITNIGSQTVIYPFASIGQIPQDLKYKGEASTVQIGTKNTIREYVTIQPGTRDGGMITKVGNNVLFMVGVHIAHDCKIGNNVIFANYVSLAGHVEVDNFAIIGGLSAVQQYVKIGKYAMVGGMSGLASDLIPFGLAMSNRANLSNLNLVGMKRHGFDNKESIEANKLVREILINTSSEPLLKKRIQNAKLQYPDNKILQDILSFLEKNNSSRPFCTYKTNIYS